MAEKWYDKSIKQTEIWLKTDLQKGLSGEEIKLRRELDGDNNIYKVQRRPFLSYVKNLITDYTSILMLVILVIGAVFNETENLVVMAVILLTYYAIMLFSYVKSRRILEGLGVTALPNAKVLRAGKLFMVKQKQLVRGDVIYVSAGDIVPCDARLVECEGLEVLEVNVTSVTHAVPKDATFISYYDIAPAKQRNMLFASTIVTKGTAKAICCETGQDTLVCKLRKNAPMSSNDKLEIIEKIKMFSKKWSIIMTLSIVVLTLLDILFTNTASYGIFGIFMTGLSLSVASMSEFFAAFAYIALAGGIFAAVNKKKDINTGALIKNTDKLDTLKDLSCLIVPRDAGFGMRDLRVCRVFANGDIYIPGEHGYKRNASRVLRYALLSTGLYGADKLIENNQRRENIYTPEEEAIISAAEACSEFNVKLEKRYPMVSHLSRGGEELFECTLVKYENNYFKALRGEYSEMLGYCRFYTEDGRVHEMTPEKRSSLIIEAQRLSKEGYKVLAIASMDTDIDSVTAPEDKYEDLNFEGYLALKETVLPEAAKNITKCKNAGIKIIMLTPDVSEYNSMLGISLGIASNRHQIITSSELASIKEGLIRANLSEYTVYQGLNLAQKRLIVRFLQESGEKVGYLCSELDDIILIKDADVGFAESITLSDSAGVAGIDLSGHNVPIYTKSSKISGGTGCEALKFVSDVVVSEPDRSGGGGFNAMLDSLICARSVYTNLHRMIKYLISSQLAKLVIVYLSMFLGIRALTPPQILFCGLFVDFAALIIIAFERSGTALLKMTDDVTERLNKPLLKNPQSIVVGVFWSVLTLLAVYLLEQRGIISGLQVTACSFVSFIITQIIVLNECKREQSIFERNVKINGAYIALFLLVAVFLTLCFTVPSFGAEFSVCKIPLFGVLCCVAVPLLMLICFEIYKLINNKVQERNTDHDV